MGSEFLRFFTGSALKTAELDYCIGEEMDVDIEACGGGVIPAPRQPTVVLPGQCRWIGWTHSQTLHGTGLFCPGYPNQQRTTVLLRMLHLQNQVNHFMQGLGLPGYT